MPTILVVDDSATDRRLMGGILERHGMAVRYAENGSGALKQLERSLPDAVLTDMQMPEMDGLQLVKAVRLRHPDVPVILITGHGSETLAADALRQGAASYVPKSQIRNLLVDSVNDVLELARGEANYRRLIEHTTTTDFQFELANEEELIEPLIILVQQMVAGMGLCDAAGRLQVGVAFEQALLNAMYHGNLQLSTPQLREDQTHEGEEGYTSLLRQRLESEPYRDRRVFVRALITQDEARLTVRDQGDGFDVQDSLDVTVTDDERAGRGLVLMWGLMDKVVYNKAGNEVTLIKRREQPREAQVPEGEVAVSAAAAASGAAVAEPLPEKKKKPQKLGELVPLDGGRSIVLTQARLSVGRDPSCDIVLPFTDVSHQHCLLYMYSGWWYVKDLKSANGVRINRTAVDQKRIAPGAVLTIATHQFHAHYSPWDLGAVGITPPVDPF